MGSATQRVLVPARQSVTQVPCHGGALRPAPWSSRARLHPFTLVAVTSITTATTLRAPPVAAATTVSGDTLIKNKWKELGTQAQWRTPTVVARSVLRDAMGALMTQAKNCAHARTDGIANRLREAGFTLQSRRIGQQVWWLVHRASRPHDGRGLYVIRCGDADDYVLQAPHSFFDRYTGRIVRQLFVEGKARAAFWNTIHRYRASATETKEDRVHPADVAHQFGSYFHAATVGAASADRKLRFIQIHGFDEKTAEGFDAVVSSGERATPPRALYQGLQTAFREKSASVVLFGEQSRVLGGTTNVQGRMLRELGKHRFCHLELGLPLRQGIASDRALRRIFADVLRRPWW